MNNAIHTLRIQNFKSIKDVELKPRRVNIIIGEPNVGKSNILEALSLLGGITYERKDRFMSSFIRYEHPRQLFYDNLVENTIKVETDKDTAIVGRSRTSNAFKYLLTKSNFYEKVRRMPEFYKNPAFLFGDDDISRLDVFLDIIKQGSSPLARVAEHVYTEFGEDATFGTHGNQKTFYAEPRYFAGVAIRPYSFLKGGSISGDSTYAYLCPPHGDNLISIIQKLPELRQDIVDFFTPYGLKAQLRVDERRLDIVKDLDGFIYSYPYSSTADTLQRLIFYLAAIESNDDAVLLFEEPEAHSYPEYVIQLAERIVASRNNQFFVVTHSPYLVTEVLEEMVPSDELRPELAVFVAYYEDYQTKIRQLSDEEVITARANGTELFLNLRQFVPGYEG